MFTDEIQAFLQRHDYMQVEPKAALIDMDGTLYDSMPFHAKAWHMMCDEAGIPNTEDEFSYTKDAPGLPPSICSTTAHTPTTPPMTR